MLHRRYSLLCSCLLICSLLSAEKIVFQHKEPSEKSYELQKENLTKLHQALNRLKYAQTEKKIYARKQVPELLTILNTTTYEYLALKSLDQILRKIHTAIKVEKVKAENIDSSYVKSLFKKVSSYFRSKEKNTVKELCEIYKNSLMYATHVINTMQYHPMHKKRRHAIKNFINNIMQHRYFKNSNPYKLYSFGRTNSQNKQSDISKIQNKTRRVKIPTNLKKHWRLCIKHAQETDNVKLKNSFRNLIAKIEKLNMLQTWIDTSFVSAQQKTPASPHATLQLLIKEYKESSDLLAELLYKKQRLTKIEKTAWHTPSECKSQWEKLKIVSQFFLSEKVSNGYHDKNRPNIYYEFQKTFNSTTPLGKQASLMVMKETIQEIEHAIDLTKSSTATSEQLPKQMELVLHSLQKAYKVKTL